MALKEEMEQQGNWLFRYRGTLPLVILLVGIAVFIFDNFQARERNAGPLYGESYKFICLGVCFFGLLIRIITIGYAPRNTSGRNTAGQLADVLNHKGIYATVRHPLYLGNFFMWLGICMLTYNFWFIVAFCFMYWVYYERIMFAEEQFLSRKFGQHYSDWASVTPAFFPKLGRWKIADQYFNWKKIIRQEKNGLAAIFLLIFLFDFIENFIWTGVWIPEMGFWLVGSVVSVALYFLIKLLRDNTTLLVERPTVGKQKLNEPIRA